MASPLQKPARTLWTRRAFWVTGAGLLVIGSQLAWFFKLFFTAPAAAPRGPVVVGTVAQLPLGNVTERRQDRFVLVHHPTGFVALVLECTHQKCPVHYVPDRGVVFCACHGSQFSTTGEVLVGPATRALDRFATTIQDAQVVVDTSRILRAST